RQRTAPNRRGCHISSAIPRKRSGAISATDLIEQLAKDKEYQQRKAVFDAELREETGAFIRAPAIATARPRERFEAPGHPRSGPTRQHSLDFKACVESWDTPVRPGPPACCWAV